MAKGKAKNKKKRPADELSNAGDSDSPEVPSQATDHGNKTKSVKKLKTVATPGESFNAIDDAINSVLTQNMDESVDFSDCGSDVQLTGAVAQQLISKVKEQQQTIDRLQKQVGFLLSYLGLEAGRIASSPAAAAEAAAGTSSSSSSSGAANGAAKPTSTKRSFAEVSATHPVPLSSALKQTVVSAVYHDFEEKERRNKNIVINGLPAGTGSDVTAVTDLLTREFQRDFTVVKCRRLGQQKSGKLQPLLVTLETEKHATYVTQNARWLRQSTDETTRRSVYINPDLTRAEAFTAYQNRCERRQRLATQKPKPPTSAALAPGSAAPAGLSHGPSTSQQLGPSTTIDVFVPGPAVSTVPGHLLTATAFAPPTSASGVGPAAASAVAAVDPAVAAGRSD